MEYWGIFIPFAEYASTIKRKETFIELLIPLCLAGTFFYITFNNHFPQNFSVDRYVAVLVNSGAILIGFLINLLLLLNVFYSEKPNLWNQIIDRTIAGVKVTLKRYISTLVLVALLLQLLNILFSVLGLLFDRYCLISLVLLTIAFYVFLVSIFILVRMGWLIYEIFSKT